MEKSIEFANFLFVSLKKLPEEERFQYALNKFAAFTQSFTLIVKYMCENMYSKNLFKKMLERIDEEKPKYKEVFKIHADYIKELLKKYGYSRAEALQVANEELNNIESYINKIEKSKEHYEEKLQKDDKYTKQELREEFIGLFL